MRNGTDAIGAEPLKAVRLKEAGDVLSCGSGEEAELSASTGCVESIVTSAYFLVSQTVTVASDASYLWTYRIYIPSSYFTFRSRLIALLSELISVAPLGLVCMRY